MYVYSPQLLIQPVKEIVTEVHSQMYCLVFQPVCFQHVRTGTDFLGELRGLHPHPPPLALQCVERT